MTVIILLLSFLFREQSHLLSATINSPDPLPLFMRRGRGKKKKQEIDANAM